MRKPMELGGEDVMGKSPVRLAPDPPETLMVARGTIPGNARAVKGA